MSAAVITQFFRVTQLTSSTPSPGTQGDRKGWNKVPPLQNYQQISALQDKAYLQKPGKVNLGARGEADHTKELPQDKCVCCTGHQRKVAKDRA